MEFVEQLNYIPKSILNYFNLLCLDNICGLKMEDEYKPSLLMAKVLSVSNNKDRIKTFRDVAIEVGTIVGLPKINSAFRTILLTNMDEYSKPNPVFAWLLCEIVPYLNAVGRGKEAIDLINDREFDNKKTHLLLSLCKSEEI
jgi:hypothetical protein